MTNFGAVYILKILVWHKTDGNIKHNHGQYWLTHIGITFLEVIEVKTIEVEVEEIEDEEVEVEAGELN